MPFVKKVFRSFIISFCLVLICPHAFLAMSEPQGLDIVESQTEADHLVLYIQCQDSFVPRMNAQIGNTACGEMEIRRLSEIPGHTIHTYILIDNSLSISEQNRTAVKELLKRLFREHTDGEVFSVFTFAEQPVLISESEDNAETLCNAVESLEFPNQNSYLRSSILQIYREMRNSQENCYSRLLVIGDGADDQEYGPADTELLDAIKENPIPVFVLGSRWKEYSKGLDFLFMLSRTTKGGSWMLDDLEDPSSVSGRLNQDARLLCCSIPVEPPLCDGSRKPVILSNGDETVSAEMKMPVISSEMLEKWMAEQEVTEQTHNGTDVVEEETDHESEEESEYMDMGSWPAEDTVQEDQEPQKNTLLNRISIWAIPILAGVCTAAVLALLYFLMIKRKGEPAEEDLWEAESDDVAASFREQYFEEPKTELIHLSAEDEDEHTRLLWKEENNPLLRLIDLTDPGRNYTVPMMKKIMIGRSAAACEISFPDDAAVSARHCCIREEEGTLILEDLGASNGTFLNGKRIKTPSVLKDGDILRIGKKELRVTIEAGQ